MIPSLAIGDFSRATHLTVKALRHYHESGLLVPAQIDARTGYRRYTTQQIQVAQVIRRFRDLDMPIDDIRAVLSTADVSMRNELIAAHLRHLESNLERTQYAVASLRDLLAQPTPDRDIRRRRVEAVDAASISAVVRVEDALSWLLGALGELHACLGGAASGRYRPGRRHFLKRPIRRGSRRGDRVHSLRCRSETHRQGHAVRCARR